MHIPECILNVTRLVVPIGDWSSPTTRVGATIEDILRDFVPREHPKGQFIIIPEHDDYTPSTSIERCASTPIKGFNAASIVTLRSASAFIAKHTSGEPVVGSCPAYGLASGVESDLVCFTVVDVLDDVNLMGIANWGVSEIRDQSSMEHTSPPSGQEGLVVDQSHISWIELK